MPVPRPVGVQCPKWEPASTGSKRCRYYIDPAPEELQTEGLCRLPDEFACVEWVRRFGTDEQRAALQLRQYPSGKSPGASPVDPDAQPPLTLAVQDRPPPRLTLVRSPPSSMPRGEPLVAIQGVAEFVAAQEVDPAGLEALERSGTEVTLEAGYLGGRVTLVPARTGRTDRVELTWRESSVIRMIVDAFPGSRVVGFRNGAEGAGLNPGTPLGVPPGTQHDPFVGAVASALSTTPEYPQGTPIGTACSVCREPQFATDGGPSCVNGHGGAEPLEEDPLS